jgi:ABC-type dipeptide/oligopeptide/nickel transport system ATPase component
MTDALLTVENLVTQFATDDGLVKAVDSVSFTIHPGESLGVVGESGSGKSVTALSIMRLVTRPGKIVSGNIRFAGQDLTKVSDKEMRALRGNDIGMIFQEPMTSLDPLYTVGYQIREAIELHQGLRGALARQAAIKALSDVGIPNAGERVDSYPHQLSGGMRQRVMIAIALSCNPKLLIADEPTTALDVTMQARILDLLRELQRSRQMALMLITHNLGIVAEICDHVIVMYKGKIVESKPVHDLFANPEHPYTRSLLNSIPRLDSPLKTPLPAAHWEQENLVNAAT